MYSSNLEAKLQHCRLCVKPQSTRTNLCKPRSNQKHSGNAVFCQIRGLTLISLCSTKACNAPSEKQNTVLGNLSQAILFISATSFLIFDSLHLYLRNTNRSDLKQDSPSYLCTADPSSTDTRAQSLPNSKLHGVGNLLLSGLLTRFPTAIDRNPNQSVSLLPTFILDQKKKRSLEGKKGSEGAHGIAQHESKGKKQRFLSRRT